MQQLRWQKSSFSGQPDGDCLELAGCDGQVLIRESDDPGVIAASSADPLRGLLAAVKTGRLDCLGRPR